LPKLRWPAEASLSRRSFAALSKLRWAAEASPAQMSFGSPPKLRRGGDGKAAGNGSPGGPYPA